MIRWWRAALVSIVASSAACSGGENAGSGGDTLEPCEPLATREGEPIELGEIVGIGRAEDGTIYVVDRADDDFRLFVSEGEVLQRYQVDGVGESIMGDATSVSLTVVELDLLLQVDVDAEGEVRMGILVGADDREILAIGEEGEELEVLDEKDIEDIPLRNLPGDVFVEYWAKVEDGRVVLVIRPDTDWDYEDFRLFLGPKQRVAEREVTSVVRQRDGGTTTIEFVADGDAVAYFPAASRDEPSTLTVAGDELELTLLSSDPSEADATFYCR